MRLHELPELRDTTVGRGYGPRDEDAGGVATDSPGPRERR